MTWTNVASQVRSVLATDGGEDLQVGLDAFDDLERLLRIYLPEVFGHPEVLLCLEKTAVVNLLAKGNSLNVIVHGVLDMLYDVLEGKVAPIALKRHKPKFVATQKEHKLKPIADSISEIFEQLFNCEASYKLEAQPAWLLSVPDQNVYKDVWDDVSVVYETLVEGGWTLSDRLQAFSGKLRSGQQRVDIWFEEPFNCIVEFDETQHFNQFRYKTLQAWERYAKCLANYDHYLALAEATFIPPGKSPFQRLKSFDPLFPPVLDGDAQDNRMRQRAFRDFLKDITPKVMPNMNPTIRISYRVTNGRIRDFTAEDLKAVQTYLVRGGGIEQMRLG
jgi:hypothetical protein